MILILVIREPARALLAVVPVAALANHEAWIERGAAYPSEAILLALVLGVALRRPAAFRWSGAVRIALAYGAWVAIAAIAATCRDPGPNDIALLLRLLRNGFLAATLAALGATLAAAGGAALWSRATLAAAGLLGALALGEAGLGLADRDLMNGVPRTGSPVGGSELLALHLSLLLPPGLAAIAHGAGGRRHLMALLAALAGGGLVLSFSRSGWAGAWAAILGMGLTAIKTDRRGGRRLLALALVTLAGGVLAVLLLGLLGGPLARAYGDRLGSLAHLDLASDRAAEWRLGVAFVREHPGLGHPAAPNPYNLALGLAATSGLPALVLFAWLVAASLAGGFRAAARGGAASPLAVGLIGAVIALLVTGIGESTLGARLTPPAFATLGLLAGIGFSPRGTGKTPERAA